MAAINLTPRSVLHGGSSKYVIVRELGRGGVGTVFEAQRVHDKLRVAAKVLHGGRIEFSDASLDRFRKEIVLATGLSHPHLVAALDHGERDGHPFLIMELLTGGTVAERITAKSYDDALAFRWCCELLAGVRFVHEHGLVHRDLKPNNLLLTSDAHLKIADLGAMRDLMGSEYLTISGDQIGSVLYISRRQRDNPAEADANDDAYSVCCCIYEILSRTRIHLMPDHLARHVRATVPAYVCDLVMGALSGAPGVETLDRLRECFRLVEGGGCAITDYAKAPRMNSNVVITSAAAADAGLARHRLGSQVPVVKTRELALERMHAPLLSFVGNDEILALVSPHSEDEWHRWCTIDLANDDALAARTIAEFAGKVRHCAFLPNYLVFAFMQKSFACIRLANDARTATQADAWTMSGVGLEDVQCVRAARGASRLVIVGYEGRPVVIDAASNYKFSYCESLDGEDKGNARACFVGSDRVAVTSGIGVDVYQIDFDRGVSGRIARIEFDHEILDVESSPDGRMLFIAHVRGVSRRSIEGDDCAWDWPTPGPDIWRLASSPCGRYVAMRLGMVGLRRVAVMEESGAAFAYLPDLSRKPDGWLMTGAEDAVWSPDGRRLAISSDYGVSVFERD